MRKGFTSIVGTDEIDLDRNHISWVSPLGRALMKSAAGDGVVLFDARAKIAAWRKEYNEERPHSSLGYLTPNQFAAAQAAGFYTAVRGARDSNAIPCPSRSPIPAQSQDGVNINSRIQKCAE